MSTDAPADSTGPARRWWAWHVVLGLLGLLMAGAPGKIANRLDRLVPEAALVTSGGTALAAFADIGSAVVRRTGLALLVAVLASVAAQRLRFRIPHPALPSTRWSRWLRPAAVFLVPFAVVLYLATPHNAFSTNSRIHWVDYLTSRSHVFFYAGGRIPHYLFYDNPPLWHAINAGLLALTLDAVFRRLGFRRWASTGLSLAFFGSAMVLLFADTGEDVLLNFLLLTLVILSLTSDRPVVRGLALGGAVLGRPEFLSLLGAYGLVVLYELWAEHRAHGAGLRDLAPRIRWHAHVGLWAVVFITASQVVFSIFGDRYLLTRGRVLDLGPLEGLDPIDLEGFVISPFSGAFVGHFVWLLPAGFLVALVIWLSMLRPSRPVNGPRLAMHRFVGVFCVAAATSTLLLHEAKPLLYFNVRYVSYTYPFVFVGGAIALVAVAARWPRARVLVWTFALLSVVAVPAHPLSSRQHRLDRVETQLFAHVHDLRDARGDLPIVMTFGGQSSRNAMSYVFRTGPGDVETIDIDELDAFTDQQPALVVAKIEQLPELPDPERTVLVTDDLVVFEAGD